MKLDSQFVVTNPTQGNQLQNLNEMTRGIAIGLWADGLTVRRSSF